MAKTARKKTAEELIEKSKKAFNSKLIVEIIEKAPVNKDGKVNLTKACDQVFDYVFEQTKDLKTAKELAVAARWLAMLKRDYPADFEEALYEKEMEENKKEVIERDLAMKYQKPEPKPKSKKVEIELFGDIIFSGDYGMPHVSMASLRILRTNLIFNGIKMAADLLESITGIEASPPKDQNWPEVKIGFPYNYHPNKEFPEEKRLSALRDYLIQILEEKFGVKVKICGNCYYYNASGLLPAYRDIGCGACEKSLCPLIKRAFGEKCCFEVSEWKIKEIPPEK